MQLEKKVAKNIQKDLNKSFNELINIGIDEHIIYDGNKFLTHIELFDYELKKHYKYSNYNNWFKLINKCMKYYNDNFSN